MPDLDPRQIALLVWLQQQPPNGQPRLTHPGDPEKAWAFIRQCQRCYAGPWLHGVTEGE